MKLSVLVVCFFLLVALPKASPYTKYGRSCRDILCIAGQEDCVMEHDPCTGYTDKCGSYPTCKRKTGANTPKKQGCATVKCQPGQFCSIRQENCAKPPCQINPVCISFRTTATAPPTRATYPTLNRHSSQNTYNSYNYGSPTKRTTTWDWARQYGR